MTTLASTRGKLLLAGGSSRVLLQDTFTRANDAGSLGVAESGQTWESILGTAFGISSNQAYNTDTANTLSIATLNAGESNGRILCTVTRTTQTAGVVFRVSDSSNFWSVQLSGGGTTLVKTVAGVNSTVASSGTAYSGASIVEITLNGSNISVSINGAPLLSGNDSHNVTATKHGIMRQQTLNNSRHDNFSMRTR